MKKIKPIILLLAGVLLLTSCNFNDIFEPILDVPETPTAKLPEKPTGELITSAKSSETDAPEEERVIYFDPSPLLSDSTFQKLKFSITEGKEFSHVADDLYDHSYNYESVYEESLKGYVFKDAIMSDQGFRDIELTYTQTYKYEIWKGQGFQEFVGEDVRIVYGNMIAELEDFRVNREELGYRPNEEVVLKNATEIANWAISDFSTTGKSPYVASVTMNTITEDGEDFDGAGVVNFVRYVHGMKTYDHFYVKFNCDGIPYEINAISAAWMSYAAYVIDEEELQVKSECIDEIFGKDYTIGEKVLTRSLALGGYYITTEISRNDSNGNNIQTRVYVPIEQNNNLPLA